MSQEEEDLMDAEGRIYPWKAEKSNSALIDGLAAFPLTKEQAEAAMREGHKVAHKYFTDAEWMCEKTGRFEFEDGCRCDFDRFWHTRKDSCWETGWKICS